MSKILFIFFFVFSFFCNLFIVQAEDIDIISRDQWGAIEDYRYLDSDEWHDILEKRKLEEEDSVDLTEDEKQSIILEAEKFKKANNFLTTKYSELYDVTEIIEYEWWHKLAWPIAINSIKNSIIIHHTDCEFDDSYTAIQEIYKYHSLNNEWWDIWYNFLIGYEWEIFEWRAWWKGVIWAHDKWNNQTSIWIWMIWNYQDKEINEKQLESLEKLIKYLIEKYDMDMTQTVANFKRCVWEEYCEDKPLIVWKDYPLIGHRDAWYTSCPWDALYAQLLILREELLEEYNSDLYYVLEKKLKKISEDELIRILALIEEKIDMTTNNEKLESLKKVKNIILSIEKTRIPQVVSSLEDSFDENNNIKVKLSYPHDGYINVKFEWNYSPKLYKKNWEFVLEFVEYEEFQQYSMNFKFEDDKLYLNDREIEWYENWDFFRVKWIDEDYLTISSWTRTQVWDKNGLYNDNKFRWDIVFYKKAWDLIVVNDLKLIYYLKWLWEICNVTSKEKIKSVIILARSYARWYMTKAEKFVWEWYQASDDPDVFQKYLGYSFEQRSPNIAKVVEETKDLIITFDWELIKPWYFSCSNWNTTSFIDFCEEHKWVIDCSHPESFPFLIWVKDPWWKWCIQGGHWVWVPWSWMKYFSNKWWNFNMIIKYFLQWVEIEQM